MGFRGKKARIVRIRALLLFQLRFRSCHLTVSARKSRELGDKHGPAARTPGPPPVPGLLNDLQQVASFPFSPIFPPLLQWEMHHPNLPGPAAAGRFPCTGQRFPVNHSTSSPVRKQSQAVQDHFHGCFQSLVGASLQSFCCLRAVATLAVPLCLAVHLWGSAGAWEKSCFPFSPNAESLELPGMLGTTPFSPLGCCF